jgi:predicted AAA+ superfamily ATPase
MIIERYLVDTIYNDLKDKMVFLGGARQVGKTTLAKFLGEKYFSNKFSYLNWDSREDRLAILDNRLAAEKDLVIFDEIHKYKDWKNYIKGLYDKYKDEYRILVTGSSRLDIFRKGGDSLLGRYHYYRLHPLSVSELLKRNNFLKPFSHFKLLTLQMLIS